MLLPYHQKEKCHLNAPLHFQWTHWSRGGCGSQPISNVRIFCVHNIGSCCWKSIQISWKLILRYITVLIYLFFLNKALIGYHPHLVSAKCFSKQIRAVFALLFDRPCHAAPAQCDAARLWGGACSVMCLQKSAVVEETERGTLLISETKSKSEAIKWRLNGGWAQSSLDGAARRGRLWC